MTSAAPNIATAVRSVFLIPGDFTEIAKPLWDVIRVLPEGLRPISFALFDSLHGVIRTLSIPFNFTHSEINSLHWQRIFMAEQIRARGIENEFEREPIAQKIAHERFAEYLKGAGQATIVDEVLSRLNALKNEAESLAAARELTRQGIVLIWSAVEVLTRDCFIYLLNRHPALGPVNTSEVHQRRGRS